MGTLYTFYSFKGGVGRSMALANVAALLANWGHSVLVIDWDLEAPGLEKYFMRRPSRLDGSRAEKKGVVDIVTAFAEGEKLDWEKECLLKAYPFGTEKGGRVDIIGAGQDTAEYVAHLESIEWRSLFKQGFGARLEEMRDEWLNCYEFVLVDSRTGFTDIGGVCTIHLPDALVLLFTANEQSLQGVIDVLQVAQAKYERLPEEYERPLRLIGPEGTRVERKLLGVPVPSRFEYFTEYESAKRWLGKFAERLAEVYADWLPQGTTPEAVLEKLFVPNIPFWSFGESLPVVQEGTSNPRSLGFAYTLLARLLENDLQWEQPLDGGASVAGEQAAELVNQEAEHAAELVNQEAERAYAGLMPGDQAVARRVFTGLVLVITSGTGSDTRRLAPLANFGANEQRVIEKLAEAGLLSIAPDETTGEEFVEIARDETLRHWERLKGWLEEDREFLLWRQKFDVSLSTWKENGKQRVDLLSGASLREARRFFETRGGELTADAKEYISASVKEDERRLRREALLEFLRKYALPILVLTLSAVTFGPSLYGWLKESNESAQRTKTPEAQRTKTPEAQAAIWQGIEKADAGDFNAAIASYNKAISSSPGYPDAYFYRGQAYANMGRKQEAIADFNKIKFTYDRSMWQEAQGYIAQLEGRVPAPPPIPDITPSVTPAPSPDNTLRPPLYLQIQCQDQEQLAEKVAEDAELGPIVRLPMKEGGSEATEIRFYRKADAKGALSILSVLQGLGINDAQTRYLIGYENSPNIQPGHYELWFGPCKSGS